ncbi:transporter [Mycobacterium sp.]|uniref:PH-like domain-containing protein n=1 Tax=Mycobacterium sp. TaxID=1785 RepID=UPI003A8A0FAF
MNSGTLVGSLIFAAVLVVILGMAIRLALRGWRHRAEQQETLIGDLPAVPDEVGAASTVTAGLYLGCTLSPAWNDRVVVGDLGYRSRATMVAYPAGILLERTGSRPIWIPRASIVAISTERGAAGRVAARDGILAVRWRLPSGTEIDTGFRADNRDEYAQWVDSWTEGAG